MRFKALNLTNPDLSSLVARFRTLTETSAVPAEQMTYLTSKVCAQIARNTGTQVRVTQTAKGCRVFFAGANAGVAAAMLRRQMGSVTGQILAVATGTILEELG